jgi:hypothetical protein
MASPVDNGGSSRLVVNILPLFFRILCTVKGLSAPNGGLPILKLSLEAFENLLLPPKISLDAEPVCI